MNRDDHPLAEAPPTPRVPTHDDCPALDEIKELEKHKDAKRAMIRQLQADIKGIDSAIRQWRLAVPRKPRAKKAT